MRDVPPIGWIIMGLATCFVGSLVFGAAVFADEAAWVFMLVGLPLAAVGVVMAQVGVIAMGVKAGVLAARDVQ